ncbi:MAG TPA: hypothetical protein VGC22_13520, partial [Chitinophaga sp.]
NTFLYRPAGPPYYNNPYNDFQYLGVHNGQLMVNGRPHPLRAVDALNGTVFLLDEVLKKPERLMIDYLKNNPNFTFYMEAIRLDDSLYLPYSGYPSFGPILSSLTYGITVFAPTNNAFHKAGFNTFEDLRARALLHEATRSPYPYNTPDNYTVIDLTSLDSLLRINSLDVNGFMVSSLRDLYFTNDFTDNLALPNLVLIPGAPYSRPPWTIRMQFSTSGDKVLAKEIGSNLAPIPLSDSVNMVFINGVIHVVDADLFGR